MKNIFSSYSKTVEGIIETIMPGGMYQFEGYENKEQIRNQIEVVLKRIKKPSKGPIGLYKQIKQKNEDLLSELENILTTKEAIKIFKKEVDIKEEFGEEIKMLDSYKDRHISEISRKIQEATSAFNIIEAQLEIEGFIPYNIKTSNNGYKENELYGYAAIWKAPILKAYEKITRSGFLLAIYDNQIFEIYNDIISLRGIMDIIEQNIGELTRPTKGVVNDGSLFFAFFAAIGCGFSDGSFSLRTFIVAFIVIEALFIIKDLWFPKK